MIDSYQNTHINKLYRVGQSSCPIFWKESVSKDVYQSQPQIHKLFKRGGILAKVFADFHMIFIKKKSHEMGLETTSSESAPEFIIRL